MTESFAHSITHSFAKLVSHSTITIMQICGPTLACHCQDQHPCRGVQTVLSAVDSSRRMDYCPSTFPDRQVEATYCKNRDKTDELNNEVSSGRKQFINSECLNFFH